MYIYVKKLRRAATFVSTNVNTGETVSKLEKVFSRQGIPDILFSDNGPQFD